MKYIYKGLNDCRAVALLKGGMKVCNVGCLGLGTCATACPFDAISMGSQGLPVVDEKLCTGCGTCEKVCPKNIINLSSVTRRILIEYTTDSCTTPCQRACPAGINISEYIHQIATGDYHKAIQIIKERNPFPTVIGRICPRPCENECRRQYIDEPVAINFLKRYAADYEKENNKRILPFKAPKTNRQIAILGGGISGLSAAFFSARLGHEPTVFESTANVGGLLRTAIAKNRLPLDILDWDIQGIVEMGVNITLEETIGEDFSINSLLDHGFEAVMLATGGWDNRLARGTGQKIEQPIPGIYLLLDLVQNALGKNNITLSTDVVFAGGDKLAIDVAETYKKSGVQNITILFREPKNYSSIDKDTMAKLKNNGISMIFNAGISSIHGQGENLETIEYTDLESGKTNSIQAQSLVLSSGRFPELIFSRPQNDDNDDTSTKTENWDGILTYKQSADKKEVGLLADSDEMTDFSAAVKAINAGRKGAVTIHKLLYNINSDVAQNIVTPQSIVQNVDRLYNVNKSERQIMPLSNLTDETDNIELEKGFSREMAEAEADRCLNCGLVCYQKSEVFSKLKRVS